MLIYFSSCMNFTFSGRPERIFRTKTRFWNGALEHIRCHFSFENLRLPTLRFYSYWVLGAGMREKANAISEACKLLHVAPSRSVLHDDDLGVRVFSLA